MKKTLLTLALLGVTSASLAATVATVNGTKIDSSLIDDQVKIYVTQSNGQLKDTPQLREQIIQKIVVHTALVQEAKKLKLDQRDDYKKIVNQALADAKKQGADKSKDFNKNFNFFKENLLEEAFSVQVVEKNPVTDKDTRALYDDMGKFYRGSEEVKLGEVITKTEADAKKVIADLKAKKNFSDVVKKYTIDENAKKTGGVQNSYVNLKDLQVGAPEAYKVVVNLKKGQFTDPINVNNNFVVFSVQDRRKATFPKYDEIKNALTAQINQERVAKAVSDVMKKTNIKQ